MKIDFTKEQFENLMKMVYLGNWMANAHKTDDTIEKYSEIENYIFSFAKDFGFEEYVDDSDANKGKFYPTRMFEEDTDINTIHDDYNNDTFWDELVERLTIRDFRKKYSIEEITKMSSEERFSEMGKIEEKYADEVEEYGIDRLIIK